MAAAALAGALRATLTHAAIRARATQRIALHSLAQLGGPGLSLLFSLAAFATMEASVTAAFWAVALAHALLLPIIVARLDYRCAPHGLRGASDILRQGLRYGLFTTAGAGLSWVTLQSIRFIIDVTLGATAVGLVFVGWGIGQRIATQIGVLATTAVFPLAAQRAREESIAAGLAIMRTAAPLLIGLLVPAVIGVWFIAEPLADLVAPEAYRAMTAAILPLATLTGAIRVFRNHFLDEMLQLDEKPGRMARLDLVEAALTVLCCLIGAWTGGIWGALVGCLIATCSATALALLMTGRLYGWPVGARDLWTIALASCAMIVTLALAQEGSGLSALAARIALGGLAYLAACLILDPRLGKALSLRWGRQGASVK
jgi:O-antigen/teichoic acid export membrane protein